MNWKSKLKYDFIPMKKVPNEYIYVKCLENYTVFSIDCL